MLLTPLCRFPRLGSHDLRILTLLHDDVHDPGAVRSLCALCDSVLHVTGGGDQIGVTVTQRKRSGKVVTSVSIQNLSFCSTDPQNQDPRGVMEGAG